MRKLPSQQPFCRDVDRLLFLSSTGLQQRHESKPFVGEVPRNVRIMPHNVSLATGDIRPYTVFPN
jgi:hypothetical protein